VADDQNQARLTKLAGAAAALVAGAVVQKVVQASWQAAKGHQPPSTDDPESGIGLGEVLAAAAITGALVGVARVLATRSAVRFTARLAARDSS